MMSILDQFFRLLMRLSCLKLLPTSPTTLSTAFPLAAPALLNARDTDFNIITEGVRDMRGKWVQDEKKE